MPNSRTSCFCPWPWLSFFCVACMAEGETFDSQAKLDEQSLNRLAKVAAEIAAYIGPNPTALVACYDSIHHVDVGTLVDTMHQQAQQLTRTQKHPHTAVQKLLDAKLQLKLPTTWPAPQGCLEKAGELDKLGEELWRALSDVTEPWDTGGIDVCSDDSEPGKA